VTLARGLPLGIDFTGGTSVVSQFDAPVSEDDVRRVMPGDSTVQRYGPEMDRSLLIRAPISPTDTGDGDSATGVRRIEATLGASGLPPSRTLGSTTIGPSIGRGLQRKGVWAMVASLAGISAYLALRFRPSFAAGAAVAVVHDIAVTVAMLSVCGYDLNLNIVAAILTVAGYSVNDTIVIFDRVRERLRTTARGALLGPAVNIAVRDTLGRTIITSGTTFAAGLALYLFGGTALEGFAFTLLVGIVVGTWSSVFVAAPVAALGGRSRVSA
jgi:preprotein translocase subunit SecF